jgi:hypothetical protein
MALARFQQLASRLEQIEVIESGSMTKSYDSG